MVDSSSVGAPTAGVISLFCNVDASWVAPPHLNNSIHLAWPKCAVYKKTTIHHDFFIYDFIRTP